MTNRKSLIVGNWKMHHNVHNASLLLHKLEKEVKSHTTVETVLCPTVLGLQSLSLQINHRKFKLGAQNCYWRDEGAYTGEVSASQLRGLVDYVLVGHSERRYVFGELDKDIRHKVQAVVRNNMKPILCVGETTAQDVERVATMIHDQIEALYGAKPASNVRILYGGSVSDENADQYLGIDRIDGLLVGGASLNAHAFAKIVDLAHTKHKTNTK